MSMKSYAEMAAVFKAMSDPGRLMIIDMLSCGEICACRLLERLRMSQPTLSHHMKILCQAGLVKGRKDGKWMRYSLKSEGFDALLMSVKELSSEKEDCICKTAFKD
jgi:ArsR family transcriptional regulator